jgi:hypothetical protein
MAVMCPQAATGTSLLLLVRAVRSDRGSHGGDVPTSGTNRPRSCSGELLQRWLACLWLCVGDSTVPSKCLGHEHFLPNPLPCCVVQC